MLTFFVVVCALGTLAIAALVTGYINGGVDVLLEVLVVIGLTLASLIGIAVLILGFAAIGYYGLGLR